VKRDTSLQSDPVNTGCNSQTKIFKGTIARPAFQCVHPETGERGDWLFVGDSHKEIGVSVSPVLPDYYELIQWTRANGWQPVGDAYVFQG